MTNLPSAKKYLGQNFLVNPNAIDRLIRECQLDAEETVLEIGPGRGAITNEIAHRVKELIAIEWDQQLLPHLHESCAADHIKIIHADILKYDLEQLPDTTKVISNLPYNIASPIIQKVIEHKHKFTEFFMMVQLEFGQRLIAQPNTKQYGSLSCFIQYHTTPKMLFRISAGSFQPRPKVESCFLKLDLHPQRDLKVANEDLFFAVIRMSFQQRRKKVVNALEKWKSKSELTQALQKLNIKENARAENLSLKEFIELYNMLTV